MVTSSTVVDERGYLFRFPTLGLPDQTPYGGCNVLIKCAIGLKDAVLLLSDESVEAPRRYAQVFDQYAPFAVEYDGAVWLLPLLVPQLPSPAAEVFTLCVRRLHPSAAPDPTRTKLPPHRPILHIQPPEGLLPHQRGQQAQIPAKAPKGIDEDGYWNYWSKQSQIGPPRRSHPGTFFISTFPVGPQSTGSMRPEAGEVDPHAALEEDWEKGVKALAFIERVKATGVLPYQDPDLWLRGAAVMGTVQTMYAVHWDMDGREPKEEEWKLIPSNAYKPGCELLVKNSIRQRMGMRLITQEELERSRPARG